MTVAVPAQQASSLQRALASARETRALEIGRGVLRSVPAVFQSQFDNRRAILITDQNTFGVAGRIVQDAFKSAAHATDEPFVFADDDLYAEHRFVERLEQSLAATDAIPVAVGSGTINDLVKLAAFRTARQYLCVATAASMDGYTAFGASITYKGSKQTFDCPAPQAVVADLEVIAAAPPPLNASGYADLAAKVTAGADWLLADALGIEPIDPRAWELVQHRLRDWLSSPAGVRAGDPAAIAGLVEGLMMGGFAMQWTKSSRPASGAEHQFSHLWDMQHHTHRGAAPSHGFKVGVATVAVTRLYEALLCRDLAQLDVEGAASRWPTWDDLRQQIDAMYDVDEIRDKAFDESRAKYVTAETIRAQLTALKAQWPTLGAKLTRHLIPVADLRQMLREAGAPDQSDAIGISDSRLRESHRMAWGIRRRYTVLDFAARAGLLDESLDRIYGT